MNFVLGGLQILLGLHTAIGAVWKFTNEAQGIPSLAAIPAVGWIILAIIELGCSVCLILPLVRKQYEKLAIVGAAFIALEMLVFSVIHIISKETDNQPMIYWLVVAAICSFVTVATLMRVRKK